MTDEDKEMMRELRQRVSEVKPYQNGLIGVPISVVRWALGFIEFQKMMLGEVLEEFPHRKEFVDGVFKRAKDAAWKDVANRNLTHSQIVEFAKLVMSVKEVK